MTAAQDKTKSQVQSGRHFVSGLGSGVTSAVLLQPLDLLKTRVQQSGHMALRVYWKDLNRSSHPIRNMWRGTLPSSLRTGFGSALYFTSLNSIRRYMQRHSGSLGRRAQSQNASSALPRLNNSANLVSGAVARTFAGFILMPLTVVKVRVESTLYNHPSMTAAIRDIYHRNGVKGFFSGFGTTAMRDAPYAGMYVLFYEIVKSRLSGLVSHAYPTTTNERQDMTSMVANSVNFTSGITAGAVCSVISNPIDVCKTRIQLQPRKYHNFFQATFKVSAEEGIRSFWDGLALRMSRKALSSALSWTIYEELVRRFTLSAEVAQ